jgi:hypothetical protein
MEKQLIKKSIKVSLNLLQVYFYICHKLGRRQDWFDVLCRAGMATELAIFYLVSLSPIL